MNSRRNNSGFTLLELLTVIAIIGLIAALVAPTISNFRKGDAIAAATRQLLDDVARARQLAISQRTTVYMIFVPANFWNDPLRSAGANAWSSLSAPLQADESVTNLYSSQMAGYFFATLHSLGDQPGQDFVRYLEPVKNLPETAFIPIFKFTAPQWPNVNPFVLKTNPPSPNGFPIYGFQLTNNIPFPLAAVATNPVNGPPYVTLPYVAFNYLGQLVDHDGNVRGYDEYIPLAHGTLGYAVDPNTKSPVQSVPNPIESPIGNSTNAYILIHIDALTGRARVERREVK